VAPEQGVLLSEVPPMRIARDLASVQPSSDAHVAVGVFDGVHCGHQRLIGQMVATAHASGKLALIYTFDPHPLAALGGQPPPLLTTVEERAEVMAALGLDALVAPPFTPEVARIRAADFARALVEQLRMVELWAGPDFALGYQREGTIPVLQRLGRELGFTVRVVEPLMCGGEWVNSSRVRAALAAGDLRWATQCLGRPYRLSGVAQPGGSLERALGWPAFLLSVPAGRLVPLAGVYAGRVSAAERGPAPALVWIPAQGDTTGATEAPIIEVYPLERRSGLDGAAVALDFTAYLRREFVAGDAEAILAEVRAQAERD